MPTPFTHLAVAQRLLADEQLPAPVQHLIDAERPAFLLGNIAADARISGNINREATHFYSYERPISAHPWRVMLEQHPTLTKPQSDAQRAFLAGYVAHLSIDELWAIDMVHPHFFAAQWGDSFLRFLMLHIILIYMDERDYHSLQLWQRGVLMDAHPTRWIPFMDDATLCDWRDFIGVQIPPGSSQTLEVLSGRVRMTPDDLRAILDDPERMALSLWSNVPHSLLAEVEAHMYAHARTQMIRYCTE